MRGTASVSRTIRNCQLVLNGILQDWRNSGMSTPFYYSDTLTCRFRILQSTFRISLTVGRRTLPLLPVTHPRSDVLGAHGENHPDLQYLAIAPPRTT